MVECTDLEDVQCRTSVKTRHLVGGGKGGILDDLLRSLLRVVRVRTLGVKARVEVNLEAVDDLVVELDVGKEGVCVVPSLGEGNAVFAVGVLRLDVADDGALGGLVTSDLEDDVRGRRGLHLKEGVADGEVLAKEVVGGLSKVLLVRSWSDAAFVVVGVGSKTSYSPSRRGELAEEQTLWRMGW